MDCREVVSLIQDPEAPRGEALERHLAACPSCKAYQRKVLEIRKRLRGKAAELTAPLAGPPAFLPMPRRVPWAWMAAAGLALYAGVAWFEPGERATPSPAPSAPPAAAFPSGILQGLCRADAGDREGVVGRSVLASLRQGGILRAEGAKLELVSGTLHLDSPGETVSVQAGPGLLTLEDGEVSVELLPKQAGLSWLASAHADEAPEVRITVWRGHAVLVTGQERTRLEKTAFPTAWRGLQGWTELESLILKDAVRDFLPASRREFVLEALVRKRVPIAELGIRLTSEAGTFEFPVGAYLQASEQWTRIRLECRGGWCRASVGASGIVSCPGAALGRLGQRVEDGGAGLHAWGGDVELKQLRWRP